MHRALCNSRRQFCCHKMDVDGACGAPLVVILGALLRKAPELQNHRWQCPHLIEQERHVAQVEWGKMGWEMGCDGVERLQEGMAYPSFFFPQMCPQNCQHRSEETHCQLRSSCRESRLKFPFLKPPYSHILISLDTWLAHFWHGCTSKEGRIGLGLRHLRQAMCVSFDRFTAQTNSSPPPPVNPISTQALTMNPDMYFDH